PTTQKSGIHADAARISAVLESGVTKIGVERVSIAREIRLYNVQFPVAIVVANGNAHARLRLAFGRQRGPGFYRNVAECSVFLVLIKSCSAGVVSNIDVGPAVVV